MIDVDLKSRIPIYEQIINQFKEQIMQGLLKEDEPLPSVRELAGELAINPNTIQKAYKMLEAEGLIYSLRGRGSFVAQLQESVIEKQEREFLKIFKKSVLDGKRIGVDKVLLIKEIEKIYKDEGGNRS